MVREKSGTGRLFYLLILLIALIILYPILQGSLFRGVTLNTIFTLIINGFYPERAPSHWPSHTKGVEGATIEAESVQNIGEG